MTLLNRKFPVSLAFRGIYAFIELNSGDGAAVMRSAPPLHTLPEFSDGNRHHSPSGGTLGTEVSQRAAADAVSLTCVHLIVSLYVKIIRYQIDQFIMTDVKIKLLPGTAVMPCGSG
jgi:hypothetical protein